VTIITAIVDIVMAGMAFPIAPRWSIYTHPVKRGPGLHNAIGENASIDSRATSAAEGMIEGVAALTGVRPVGLEANQGDLARFRYLCRKFLT
jgi:hypothetical protein